jgi:CRISPR-associated endonuclease Cas2
MKKERKETREIIETLKYVGEIVIAMGSPFFGRKLLQYTLDEIIHMQKADRARRNKYYKSLKYLDQKKYISIKKKGGNKVAIKLSPAGIKKSVQYEFEELELEKPEKWDGKWRIIIFDIKSGEKRKREQIRWKLKKWNFFMLQKSVWVCPYDLFKEAEILRSHFSLSRRELKIITATHVEDEKWIKKHFKLDH